MEYVLTQLATEQDYFWFVALLLWSAVAFFWWRDGRTLPEWRWLSWSAASGCLLAVIEIAAFASPVRPVPGVPPHFFVERLLVIAAMLAPVGWIWVLRKTHVSLRLAAITALVGLAAYSWSKPTISAFALASVALMAWGISWPSMDAAARSAMGCHIATFWVSGWGVAGEYLDLTHRWHSISTGSVVWSSVHTLSGLAALLGLILRIKPRWAAGANRSYWRVFTWATGGWLILGLILASIAGRMARNGFETGALARAKVAAALMDHSALSRLLQPTFVITEVGTFTQPTGQKTPTAKASRLTSPDGASVRQALALIDQANPDASGVYLEVARGGHFMLIPSAQRKTRPGQMAVVEPKPNYSWQEWSRREGFYQSPALSTYGVVTQARAPIFAESGRKLGWLWLQFPVGSWVASQAHARLLVFGIVICGLGIAGLIAAYRIRIQEREEARAAASISAHADRLKTTFLAKVSHELRTPIQSILGYGELLRNAIHDPVGRSRLEAQRQHGNLMLRLVNDLLDLSAIQAGAFRLTPKPTPLVDLVRQTAESLAPRARAKGVEFSFDSHAGVPDWALVDGERVRQVVLNLVSNAIKFTDRGRIDVSLRNEKAPGVIVLSVNDTGPGIPPQEHAELFQPFSRLEATAAKEGTGLGLALAAAICRSMAGNISLRSAPGEGACFEARLQAPACPPPATSEAGAGTDPRLRGMRIVVADDNALVRELFAAFLEESGASCRQAADGEAAIDLALRERPDAAVLDLAMPRCDGCETARQLRLQFGPGLRIVAVSAHAADREREAALDAGADVFLTKPIELGQLAAAIVGRPAGSGGRVSSSRADLIARLTAQFRTEAPAQREAIVSALMDCDYASVRTRAHYLKNSAAVVGDSTLFDACAALEGATAHKDERTVQAAWQRCESALAPWIRPDSSPFSGDGSPAIPSQQSTLNEHA